ncbi:GIY-YIG nuclease family protein [Muricauda sp. NFXS6]|uniref:GIY-YIG nuclease family protein n=1 Tax=Allomuricauda sp. NFXS6 TaxID=2819094 RepID=UPI0032DFB84A
MEISGIIYRAVNRINGKVYVGATKMTLEQRKSDHLTKAKYDIGSTFHRAINKYSPDAFEWEEIAWAKNVNELAVKERFYIRKNDSFLNGYNNDRGGGFKKEVYCYWRDGELIGIYPSLARAAFVVLGKKKGVSNACIGNNLTYKGFFWSYENHWVYPVTKNEKEKTVVKLSMNRELLNVYPSVSQAAKDNKLGKSSIARVCRNERQQAGGYIWRYK